MNCFAKCIFGIEHGKHVVGNINISFITNILHTSPSPGERGEGGEAREFNNFIIMGIKSCRLQV